MALQAAKLHIDTPEKKRNTSTDGGQLYIKDALRSNIFPHPFFASGPPKRLRSRLPDSRHSPTLRGRPRDALFCITSTTKCIKGSCKPIRLLEAAELLEADQRKHEGGHSKETSSGLDRTSFGSVPRATPDFPKLRTWPWNLCWAEAFVNMAVDKCQ